MAKTAPEPINLGIKRVYDFVHPADGTRYLVDRFWPRGVGREGASLSAWLKDVAPSNGLREWFGHDRKKWDLFVRRYHRELRANPLAWQPILAAARRGRVTLVYAAEHPERNNANALRMFLERVARERR